MAKGGYHRVLLALTIFFVITTLVLVAVLIWRETGRNTTNIHDKPFPLRIKEKYPEKFRTLEEQSIYEKHIQNVSRLHPTNQTIITKSFCNADCQLGQPIRKKRATQSNTMFHSCCVSSTSFDSPNTKTNIGGVAKTLLQFTSMRQYFKIQSCSQAVGCTGCTCNLEVDLNTAIVLKHGINLEDADDVDDTEIDFFYFQGCCKCLNTGVSING